MKYVEYSLIVHRKLKDLGAELTEKYGERTAKQSVRTIIKAANGLDQFPKKGVAVSELYDIESEYRYLYVGHHYLFYRIEDGKVIVVEMFHEKEDFIWKLFRLDSRLQESGFTYEGVPVTALKSYEKNDIERELLAQLQEAEEAVKDGKGWMSLDELKAAMEK